MYVIREKTNKTKDKQKTTTMKVLTLLLLYIVAMQCCNATTTMETSNDAITGYVSLGQSTETKDFNLTWTINDDTITFTLSSRGPYDWFAFGLHDQVGQGMANAEVFMCNPQTSNLKKLGTFCQVRNTLNGYSTPSVDATQYIKLKDEQLRDKCLALPVIKSLVQWKWNSLYKVLILEFVFYIALIALYTLWVSHLPLENATSKDIAPNLVYCMLSLMGPFTMIEFAQKRPRATALIGKLQWKEILMDGTTSALIFLTIISSLYENSVTSFYHNIAVACTMLLLCWRVVTAYLCALSSFAFMMLMMQSVLIYIFPFMILLLIIMFAFSAIFFIFTEVSNNGGVVDDNTITKRAWDVYKLAIMGDFGDEIESSVFMQASFIVITMIINIIMLNILISLVCEGFSDALQRKDKEFNIQRTAKVVELEATYLSGKNRTFKFGLAEPVTFHDTAWPNWLLPSLPRSTGREGKETVDEPLIIRVS